MQLYHEKKSLLVALGFLCILGCRRSETPSSPTSTVTGVVSYQRIPLPKGNVLFQHQSGKTVSADIQSDGSYQLKAFQGKNKVSVVSRESPIENPQGRPRTLPGKSLIPRAFGEFRRSGLTATVQPDENKFDFNLQDGAVKR